MDTKEVQTAEPKPGISPLWPTLLTEEPDWIALAVFADWCLDEGWEVGEQAIRFMVENRHWPEKAIRKVLAPVNSAPCFAEREVWRWHRGRLPKGWLGILNYPAISETCLIERDSLERALLWYIDRYLEIRGKRET